MNKNQMADHPIHHRKDSVKVTVKGRVQGVGFRPFIYRLAERHGIRGTVQNNMDGVFIHAEGKGEAIRSFLAAIREEAPRLSKIHEIRVEPEAWKGYKEFTIIPSEREGKSSLVIPVDSAVCEECLKEMRDPENFRYRYPFINCTQCGPRYTIIEALPYDRPYTSMKRFIMCEACEREYKDPLNRRHHAQPNACPACGPRLELVDLGGTPLPGDPIEEAKQLLRGGKIIAVKGIGGYHLACDATEEEAVARLRRRKNRPKRPLAIMAANLAAVHQICEVSEREEKLLSSPEAPILILRKKEKSSLAPSIAPGMATVGVMLPYTPLHHLLLEEKGLPYLVMTSANPSGLPILYRDEEALAYMEGIADFILWNNRPILHPLDDSVVRLVDGRTDFLRRSRGYVPDPLFTEAPVHGIVALGGEQKNTFAIGRYGQIFIGPHIGDMENLEVIDHFKREFQHLMKWMGIAPEAIAVDLHPQFSNRKIAEEIVENEDHAKIIPVQHHHAHMASCMGENGMKESSFGLILDGTGYGEDGKIWGFEFFYGDYAHVKRLAHLRYTPLPGGEKAIREPWRNAVGMLVDLFGEEGEEWAKRLFPERVKEIPVLVNMVKKAYNTPLAGTCGRLFDAVSAILGICPVSTYDGEAAILLSEAIDADDVYPSYPYSIHWKGEIAELDMAPTIASIVKDRFYGKPVGEVIGRFHETIVSASIELITTLSDHHPSYLKNLVLSGGSFHNPYLITQLQKRMKELGFQVFTHHQLPTNDGGLSYGQLMVAAHRRRKM
ncbi:carbamoyltransferase HypF [Thermicanus aegyptius]|uniref:carbamoyltransferase HypF n=1 Tax=Thermicanus aegyptius TaxID=94009 RepID=UPI000428DFE6|nr:carbamoyltransferase HypF [Thermicanus aegyptius]